MERWASLGMMVEEIAHQIRNPVVAIGGYTQRLLKALSVPSKGKSYLQQILQETKRLETMIRRVEEYVLIPKPAFQKETIQKVVEAVIQEFYEEVTEKGISINLETGGLKGVGDFFIDKVLLARALFYILENSIEAFARIPMDKKGRVVKVSLLGDKENVGVSISDKGEGIPKKNLKRIFEPFFSTRPDRVGLGLTYAKRVVEEQGGNIQVESRLKRGTTVTLTFPRDRRRRLRREQISPGAMGENID
jgi:signal transduction histidine kinase